MKIQVVNQLAKGEHLLVNGKDVGEVIHVGTRSGCYLFLTAGEEEKDGWMTNTRMYYHHAQMECLLAGRRVTQKHKYNGSYSLGSGEETTYELKEGIE